MTGSGLDADAPVSSKVKMGTDGLGEVSGAITSMYSVLRTLPSYWAVDSYGESHTV